MFECGQWVHVRDHLTHPFAGYDGEVVLSADNDVVIQIYDMTSGKEAVNLDLIPYVCVFNSNEIELVNPGRATTMEIFKHAIEKWNKCLNED